MCGVVAVIGKQNASELVIEGLKKLEYRGYDSAGIASISNETLNIIKSEGKLINLINKLSEVNNSNLKSVNAIAMGHTRWATHGNVNVENAHPLTSENKVAVIHNGIIENYELIKNKLISEGYSFKSQTDTEVLPHLFTKYIKLGNNLLQAGRLVLKDIKGAFAFVAMSLDFPGELFVSRNSSPLAIGLGDKSNFVGSDAHSIDHLTQKIIYLEDGDHALIRLKDVQIFNMNDEKVDRKIINIKAEIGLITKGGYRHFMEKEIFEQPSVIPQTISTFIKNNSEIKIDLNKLGFKNKNTLLISAAGTSYYAAMVGKYWIEQLADLPVMIDVASEYRYRRPSVFGQSAMLVVSQSGESLDTLMALRHGKELGLNTIAIVNVEGSTIDREVDYSLYTRVGAEIGVASTKSFTSQLVILFLIAVALGKKFNKITTDQIQKICFNILALPNAVAQMLNMANEIKLVAQNIKNAKSIIFLGRGLLYPLALEGALKLKEISYIHAEGFAAGEMKHGPIALIEDQVPVIMFLVSDGNEDKAISNLQEAYSRGAKIILFADKNCIQKASFAHHKIEIPNFEKDFKSLLSPFLMAIPAQLLAYHVANERGTDVDQPRNLAKSVTVE
ncbi:MAG: glutamine--fructose-6-phosphate transaminase (isomerizing) [Alphaproteobacteria bacterium TMED199]|nr:MAG: glutamine--fructose-6-phosphate transaminase (isomerizing) [Alphaproteobacteria bacterium TMED199]